MSLVDAEVVKPLNEGVRLRLKSCGGRGKRLPRPLELAIAKARKAHKKRVSTGCHLYKCACVVSMQVLTFLCRFQCVPVCVFSYVAEGEAGPSCLRANISLEFRSWTAAFTSCSAYSLLYIAVFRLCHEDFRSYPDMSGCGNDIHDSV